MDKKQYNNIIDWTLKHEESIQTNDFVGTAKAIFNNMGVALPQGNCAEIADTLKSDDYMGWKSCTAEEAQEAANNGTAAIAVSDNDIIVVAAEDDKDPITITSNVMTLSTIKTETASSLQYYAYNNTTTKKRKAIVIIPGIVCSSLQNAQGQKVWFCYGRQDQIACNEDGISVNAIFPYNPDNYGVLDIYKNLYNLLDERYSEDYDIIFFDYDWRMSCATAAEKLERELSNYNSCIFIAHSMGGIVASSFLSSSQSNRNKVSKLIAVGTPFMGAPKALYVIETGELFENTDFLLRLSDYALNIPAIYELLPTERYLESYSWYINNNGNHLSGYTNSTNFLKTCSWAKKTDGSPKPMFDNATSFHNSLLINDIFVTDRADVDLHIMYGTGNETIMGVAFDANGEYDYYYYADHGDGTVPLYSALNRCRVGDYQTYSFNETHVNLIKSNQCIQTIVDIIDNVSNYAISTTNMTTKTLSDTISNAMVPDTISTENKKITIVSKQLDNICIKTKSGFELYKIGDELYYDLNGQRHKVGTVWKIKDKSYQYVLNNDEYILSNMHAMDTTSSIRIDYCNYGLSETMRMFDNINCADIITIKKCDSSITTKQGIELKKA